MVGSTTYSPRIDGEGLSTSQSRCSQFESTDCELYASCTLESTYGLRIRSVDGPMAKRWSVAWSEDLQGWDKLYGSCSVY